MARHAIVGVIFEVDSQRNAPGRYTVPDEVCEILGLGPGSEVRVSVESATGPHGPARKTLKSDREPSPVGEMSGWMSPGERIRVTVLPGW